MSNYPKFYAGQQVVAINAHPQSKFKNGQDYIVAAIEYKINPANGTGPYWYIGIVGHDNGSAWYNPAIFASKKTIQFVKRLKQLTHSNNKNLPKIKSICRVTSTKSEV